MRIPIKYAIDSGAWFHCKVLGNWRVKHDFRVKILSVVKKIERDSERQNDGITWEMKLEVVNLYKESMYSFDVLQYFAIKDQDEYIFRHYDCSFRHEPLNPKIKYNGAIHVKRIIGNDPLINEGTITDAQSPQEFICKINIIDDYTGEGITIPDHLSDLRFLLRVHLTRNFVNHSTKIDGKFFGKLFLTIYNSLIFTVFYLYKNK